MENFMFYFQQGLFHVLDWKAYDHILFLIALTVIYSFSDWIRILFLITLFTLGHTLTLLLAAYEIIQINTIYIEFLIPATIFITALFNLFTAGKSSKKSKISINLIFAFFFGLIHGLGFAGYFRMIVAANEDKLLPLLEFALGIEAAQLVVVLLILILGFSVQTIFRFSKRDWVLVISSLIMGIVIPILIENKFW
jgi:hypothetical protein